MQSNDKEEGMDAPVNKQEASTVQPHSGVLNLPQGYCPTSFAPPPRPQFLNPPHLPMHKNYTLDMGKAYKQG